MTASRSEGQIRAIGVVAVFVALVALVVTLSVRPVPLLAKGSIEKITVSGRVMTAPIEIIDEESLAPLEPWPVGLIEWSRGPIAEVPRVGETYQVSFFLEDLGFVYSLRFSTDPSGGPGYVYVPGQGDPECSRNIGRIGTGDDYSRNPSGEWYQASDLMGSLMQKTLGDHGFAPTSEQGTGVWRQSTLWSITLGALLLFCAAAIVLLLGRRRRHAG